MDYRSFGARFTMPFDGVRDLPYSRRSTLPFDVMRVLIPRQMLNIAAGRPMSDRLINQVGLIIEDVIDWFVRG